MLLNNQGLIDTANRAAVTCERWMSNSMRILCPPSKLRYSELQVSPHNYGMLLHCPPYLDIANYKANVAIMKGHMQQIHGRTGYCIETHAVVNTTH